MSELVVSTTSSLSMQSSSSVASSSNFATSTEVSQSGGATVKSTTTVKSSKTVKTTKTTMRSSSKATVGTISIRSSNDTFSGRLGIDLDKEVEKVRSQMDKELSLIRQQVMQLLPLERAGSSQELVKLDRQSLVNFVDEKAGDNRVRFNFDVSEFEAESVCVKAVGNKIEVHAKRKSIKGDEEKSEEYSRTYEMPSPGEIKPASVTSSFYKDGVLTVELPVEEAKQE